MGQLLVVFTSRSHQTQIHIGCLGLWSGEALGYGSLMENFRQVGFFGVLLGRFRSFFGATIASSLLSHFFGSGFDNQGGTLELLPQSLNTVRWTAGDLMALFGIDGWLILLSWRPAVIPFQQMPLGGQTVDFQHRVSIDSDVLLVTEIVCFDLVQKLLVQRVMQCIHLTSLTRATLPFSGVKIFVGEVP